MPLLGMVQLADEYYTMLNLSEWMNTEIIPSFGRTPIFMRVDVLAQLAEAALRHHDFGPALAICDRMEGSINEAALPVRFMIPEKNEGAYLAVQSGR